MLPDGLQMPVIGFGTSGLAMDEIEKALDAALEVGYRHIDTAAFYGTEEVIGTVLKKWFESGRLRREEVWITTKLPPEAEHPDRVASSLKQSLQNLQLDYVDLYLIHVPFAFKSRRQGGVFELVEKTDHVGVWKSMEDEVDNGRARNIGLSNFSRAQIENILNNCRIKPANHQIEVHARFQQSEMIGFCRDNGISVTAFTPLGSPGYNDRMARRMPNFEGRPLPNLFQDETVIGIARKYSRSAAQVLLRFLIQLGVCPIPKSANRDRMRENFEIFDFELEQEDVVTLKKLDLGEDARIIDLAFCGVVQHPDYPFKRR